LNDKIDVQQKNKDLTNNDHKHKYHNCQPGFTNQHNLKSDLLGNLNTANNSYSAENAETTNKNISCLNKHNKDLPITVTASKDGLSLNINLNLQGLADLNSKN